MIIRCKFSKNGTHREQKKHKKKDFLLKVHKSHFIEKKDIHFFTNFTPKFIKQNTYGLFNSDKSIGIQDR